MDDCWLFAGEITEKGYGRVNIGGKNYGVHRLMYEELVGEIPQGLVIDHLCRVTQCCNPAHLEAVTNTENILRGVGFAAENARKKTCPQGHFYRTHGRIRKIDGARVCRECHKVYCENWRRKKALAAVHTL